MKIFCVRHGALNLDDDTLNETGRKGLLKLKATLDRLGFRPRVAYVSGLHCSETATILAPDAEIRICESLACDRLNGDSVRAGSQTLINELVGASADCLVVAQGCVPAFLAFELYKSNDGELDMRDIHDDQATGLGTGCGWLVEGCSMRHLP